MQIEDVGVIIEIKKFSERDALIWIFSEKYGVVSGLIKSFQSKNNRNKCSIGNLVEFVWKARLAEHLGILNIEIKKLYQASFLTSKLKLTALSAVSSTLYNCLPERLEEKFLYKEYINFLENLLTNPSWIEELVRFELNLLAELGFGLDLTECVATKEIDDLYYISPKSAKAVSREAGKKYHDSLFIMPKFFLDNNIAPNKQEIHQALKITSYFINKFLLQPKNNSLNIQRNRLNDIYERAI